MKKFIPIIFLIMTIPAIASCPIDGNETMCSLPEMREQFSPIFEGNNNVIDYSNPGLKLQPIEKEEKQIDQMRGPNNSLNYDSSCQFGLCLPGVDESLKRQPSVNPEN